MEENTTEGKQRRGTNVPQNVPQLPSTVRLDDITLTVEEVAMMLRITRHGVLGLLKQGEFTRLLIGHAYRITYASVKAFIKRRVAMTPQTGSSFPDNFKTKRMQAA
jgi:excisionase family DNA binding protein